VKRVKFRDRKQGAEMSQYILALTLLQKRHSEAGKGIPVLSAEEIAALTPSERRKLRQQGWGAKLTREDFLTLRVKSRTD
jgi:hypothetical protein